MPASEERQALVAAHNEGEEVYWRVWMPDGCTPVGVKVDVFSSSHDFAKGGWFYKVKQRPENGCVVEVHESQLYRAEHNVGDNVRVSRIGLESKLFYKAVVKAVKAQGHTFTYDLTVDLDDVKATNIVESREPTRRVSLMSWVSRS